MLCLSFSNTDSSLCCREQDSASGAESVFGSRGGCRIGRGVTHVNCILELDFSSVWGGVGGGAVCLLNEKARCTGEGPSP